MSREPLPDPMDCIADLCPFPPSCDKAGRCIERDHHSQRCFTDGLAACREAGITDPFRKRESP